MELTMKDTNSALNARAGSIRSPLWRHGAVTFAARPQDYSEKVNRKMYSTAIKSILSELVRQNRLVVVNEFSVDTPKTKALLEKLKSLDLQNVFIVDQEVTENLYLASRNLGKSQPHPPRQGADDFRSCQES